MSANSRIEWCDSSWNPMVGCSHASPGCDNCYAERMARRQVAMGNYPREVITSSGGWSGNILWNDNVRWLPHRWRRGRRIFVCSMSDLFHPDAPVEAAYHVISAAVTLPQHTFIVLTKHPTRMKSVISGWIDHMRAGSYRPIENMWLGVTVEDQQRADERIPLLLECPAVVRFVSVEPMLGPVDLRLDHKHAVEPVIDWVIAGGETGPGARRADPEWLESLRDQCIAGDVPFFFKGHGTEAMRKSDSGYMLLDGREWREFPRCAK